MQLYDAPSDPTIPDLLHIDDQVCVAKARWGTHAVIPKSSFIDMAMTRITAPRVPR